MAGKIPFIKPKFPEPEELVEDLRRIYKNNYYSNNGPVYFEFKEAIENYLGQGLHAVLVSNATLGLMLAIQAAFGTSNERKYIAIPSFTFAAGPLATKWCGFQPLFIDINAETSQPSLNSFRQAVDAYPDQIAGALLTNSFGIGNGEIDEWDSMLNEYAIPYIVDSAPGLGSTYMDGKLLGARGRSEVFSLHATKPFGIGEGGLITTTDQQLASEYESLKNFGFDKDKMTTALGINAKITELDCAIGLRILRKYEIVLEDRRKTYKRYQENLKGFDVGFLPRAESASIQFATIIVPAEKRQKVLAALEAGGVEVRTYYAPSVHTFPLFKDDPVVELRGTKLLSKQVLSLPVHPNMDESTVDYICDIITQEL